MKKFFTYFALAVFLSLGIYTIVYTSRLPRTYDGSNTSAQCLMNDPSSYNISDAKGISDIIVNEDLAKTRAMNSVTAVVFDFRGYDTLGESFILLTAISGSMIILRNSVKGSGHKDEKEH